MENFTERDFFQDVLEYLQELGMFGDVAEKRAREIVADEDERMAFLQYFYGAGTRAA